jgi:DNA-binding MarR family transcriptional regulator
LSENGAEVVILGYLAEGNILTIGNDIRGMVGCAEAAERIGLTASQVFNGTRNMASKEEVERKATDKPGVYRVMLTGLGVRRIKRIRDAQKRRAERDAERIESSLVASS